MNANQKSDFAPSAVRLLKSAALLCVAAAALGGCSRMANGPSFPSNPFAQETAVAAVPEPAPAVTASPVARLEQQASGLDLTGYVSSSALQSMSAKDKSEAASAQFFALQFGRPGAPRNWSGDSGTTGEITVGPFITRNSMDCREYSHTVTISGTSYAQDGTSCRGPNGDWRASTSG